MSQAPAPVGRKGVNHRGRLCSSEEEAGYSPRRNLAPRSPLGWTRYVGSGVAGVFSLPGQIIPGGYRLGKTKEVDMGMLERHGVVAVLYVENGDPMVHKPGEGGCHWGQIVLQGERWELFPSLEAAEESVEAVCRVCFYQERWRSG